MPPWLIVAGDFARTGGVDKLNYHLAWHLAEELQREVCLVGHGIEQTLVAHGRIRIERVPRPWGRHAIGAFFLSTRARAIVLRQLRQRPETRLLVNGGGCSVSGAVNWVHMVQQACTGRDEGSPLLFRAKNRLVRHLARRRERSTVRVSRLVLANSHQTRRHLIELLGVPPDHVEVVYPAVDPHEFGPITKADRERARSTFDLGENKRVILFVGALGYDRNKGFDTLLAGVRHLHSRGEAACILAAGSGALPFWQRAVDEVGLAGHVHLLGAVPKVGPLIAAADVLVSPTRFDGYGLAVHEALCRGVPVFVSRTAGVAERIPALLSRLILEDPDDAVALADRLLGYFRNPEALQRQVVEFAEEFRRYTYKEMAERVVALVESPARLDPASAAAGS